MKNSWPWIAHMKFGGRLCAGVIINENHVITAAHCCTEVSSVGDITLKVGEHDSSVSGDGERQEKFKIPYSCFYGKIWILKK